MTQDPNAGVFAPAPGTQQPAQPLDMQGNPVTTQPRTFGPIQQPTPDTNALLAQLLQALGGANAPQANTTPAGPVQRSPEDQRVLDALASVHPAGRDAALVKRTTIGGGLYFVKYSYNPATGVPQTAHALVYDDGANAHVFEGGV